jgi:hypothetical protein
VDAIFQGGMAVKLNCKLEDALDWWQRVLNPCRSDKMTEKVVCQPTRKRLLQRLPYSPTSLTPFPNLVAYAMEPA